MLISVSVAALLILSISSAVLQHASGSSLPMRRGGHISSSIHSLFHQLTKGSTRESSSAHVAALQPTTALPSKPKKKLGVLLLNLGGPETIKDVQGFLYNLFADPDIIRLPRYLSLLQKPLAFMISTFRSGKSAAAYGRIGGGSPIVKYTNAQARLLEEKLRAQGDEVTCAVAMRYWKPFTDQALKQLEDAQVEEVVVLPLYPQYSISTTSSSLKALLPFFENPSSYWSRNKIPYTVVKSWYHRKDFTNAMARLVLEQIYNCSAAELEQSYNGTGIHVLFSAHGVPESYISAGDPYRAQMCCCVNQIANEVVRTLTDDKKVVVSNRGSRSRAQRAAQFLHKLDLTEQVNRVEAMTRSPGFVHGAGVWPTEKGVVSNTNEDLHAWSIDRLAQGNVNEQLLSSKQISIHNKLHFHLSFQSRVGPVQWLKPYTDAVIERLGKDGVKSLIVVPISFVSDHIETLEEIDLEYKELAHHSGVTNWRRVAALNTENDFIECMKNVVNDAREKKSVSLRDTIVALKR